MLCTNYSTAQYKKFMLLWETCDLLYRHKTNKFWIPAKNVLNEFADLEMNALWMIECLTPKGYETKVSDETSNDCKRYFSASETSFKERLRKNTWDLKHTKYGKRIKL